MSAYLIKNLDIVGYLGSVNGRSTMPRQLQRVFKHRTLEDRYIFPPYAIAKACVHEPVKISGEDFRHMVTVDGEVTELKKSIKARKSYNLWCDDEGRVKHGSYDDMLKDMASISCKHIAIAVRQFKNRKFRRAIHQCEMVRSATQSNVDALVLKAACLKMVKDEDDYNTTVQVGCSYLSKSTFLLLVSKKIKTLIP